MGDSSIFKDSPVVLVTGGAGFIGWPLCRALALRGAVVRVLDRQDPASAVPGVQCRRADINTPGELEDALRGARWVYHLAAIASVERCEREAELSHRTNVEGSLRLLDALEKQRRRGADSTRLVFTSSAAIYGMAGADGSALREDVPAVVPNSRYAEQKYRTEKSITQWCESQRSTAALLRLFNVFGTDPDSLSASTGVLAVLRECLVQKRPFHLHGGGRQTRDFVALEDVIGALLAAMTPPRRLLNARVINIGSGRGTSILALVKLASDLCGQNIALIEGPERVGDVPHSVANVERAAHELRWSPRVSLEEGFRSLLSPMSDETEPLRLASRRK